MTNLKLETLADGFVFLEGPRWHDNRLWLSDMWGNTVYTLTAAGKRTTVARLPNRPSGISFLPDGRMVVVSMTDRKLMQVDGSGNLSTYVDLTPYVSHDINDSVADQQGNIYVGNFGYDLLNHADPKTADLIMVTAKREIRVVARDLNFPNGTVITPDGRTLIIAETFASVLTAFDRAEDGSLSNRRIWAELGQRTPDGMCLDQAGAIWVSSFVTGEFVRVLPNGTIAEVIPCPGKRAVACNLGGDDGRTLFALTFAGELADIASGQQLARVEVCRVEVPGAGSP